MGRRLTLIELIFLIWTLLNAARLVREHPELMRLKELQTLAQIAQQQGHLVITPLGSPPAVAVVADAKR